jgi:hypothetical protein
MSTNPPENGRRRVVVAPVVAPNDVPFAKFLLIWLGSLGIHGILLFLAFFVFNLLNVRAAAPTAEVEVATTTEVIEQAKEPDLTNVDLGIDDTTTTQFAVDKIEDVSVPGMVDPTAPAGIVNAPEDSLRATVPAPPGTGAGSGGAPLLPDGPGVGNLAGTLGGMGGNYFVGAFAGRSGATREKLLQEGGGNQISEAAVARGLEWLALHQAQDGHWGLHDFNRHARDKALPAGKTFTCNCDGAVSRRNDVAATAFALLPFLAGGITHKPTAKPAQKDYTKAVHAGLFWLIGKQGKDGYYGGDMYSHGLATIAMCEAYGLTSDPLLKASAQKAINFVCYAQDSAGGGWRYAPKTAGDTSVTGWQLMALKSGQMAGLSVPRATLALSERFLDSVESANKGGYSYTPGSGESYTMTAVGLLCRQYQGVNPRNPGLLAGVERLKQYPPGATGNLYYEYYATQVMHHMGGESWQFWNLGKDGKSGIRDTLIAKQQHNTASKQHIEGSWGPETAPEGGRIMSTSLSLLCLEVYYRHLPLYRRDLGGMKAEK